VVSYPAGQHRDQCDELIGAQAVELLIAQLNQNERGPPRHPGMMLFPGQWIETAVARVC